MSTINTVTEQLTRAGQAIEHDSFAIIDAEVQAHSYTAEQWPIVRRMIHANADFDFNGLTDFHPQAVHAGITAMLRGLRVKVRETVEVEVRIRVDHAAHDGPLLCGVAVCLDLCVNDGKAIVLDGLARTRELFGDGVDAAHAVCPSAWTG